YFVYHHPHPHSFPTRRSSDLFHHALNMETPLRYQFLTDAQKYQTDELKIDVPALVFHGNHDETVPVGESVRFAEINRDLVELHLDRKSTRLNSSHVAISYAVF